MAWKICSVARQRSLFQEVKPLKRQRSSLIPTIGLAGLVFCISACATADGGTQDTATSLVAVDETEENVLVVPLGTVTIASAAVDDTDPVICKTETIIGTRLARKVCARESDRENRTIQSRNGLEDLQRGFVTNPEG